MAAAPKRLRTIGFAIFDLVCLVHKSTAWFFCSAFWVAGLSVPANKKTPFGEPLRLGIGGSLGKYVTLKFPSKAFFYRHPLLSLLRNLEQCLDI